MMKRLERLSCEERLRKLWLFSRGEDSGESLEQPLGTLRALTKKKESNYFYGQTIIGQKGMVLNLKTRFRLDFRKKVLTVREVRKWNQLPREVMDVPFLETFQTRMDEALSNLV